MGLDWRQALVARRLAVVCWEFYGLLKKLPVILSPMLSPEGGGISHMNIESRQISAGLKQYNVRRRERRFVFSAPLTVQRFLRLGPFVTRGISLDLSLHGMSGLVCGAPRVGETVVISLPFAGVLLEMLATVRHSTDANSGFEFYQLSPMAHQAIQNWIGEIEKQEHILKFSPPFFRKAAGVPDA